MNYHSILKTAARVAARLPALGSATINGLFYAHLTPNPVLSLAFFASFFAIDMAKPEVASYAIGRRSVSSGAGVVVLVLLSLVAATSSFMGERVAEATSTETAQEAYSRASRIVDGIRETATVAELEALAASAHATAEREAGNGGCGKVCEQKMATHAALIERVADAKARDQALAVMEASKPAMVTGATEAFSRQIALFLGTTTGTAILLVAALAAIGLEFAATLLPHIMDERLSPRPVVTVAEAVQAEPKDMEIEDWIIAQIGAAGGTARLSNKAVAQRFGVSPATASRVRSQLERDGLITVDRSGREAVLSVA